MKRINLNLTARTIDQIDDIAEYTGHTTITAALIDTIARRWEELPSHARRRYVCTFDEWGSEETSYRTLSAMQEAIHDLYEQNEWGESPDLSDDGESIYISQDGEIVYVGEVR